MSRKPFGARKLRFEPLERRELLTVSVGTVHNGYLEITADAAGDEVHIAGHTTAGKFYVCNDSNFTDAEDDTVTGVTGRVTIELYTGAKVTFHTQKIGTGGVDAQLKFPGNLVIVGSTAAKDTIKFTDDATGGKGGAKIAGDFLFTGLGGGDELTIEAPKDAAKTATEVGRHVSIDSGNDSVNVKVKIEDLKLTRSAATSPGANFSLSTGGASEVQLTNVTLGTAAAGGDLKLNTGSGVNTVTLNNVDLNGGNLTMQTGDGNDVVSATSLKTGNALVDLGAAADTLTLNTLDTNGEDLVLLGDGGTSTPGGADTFTLTNIDLDGGNLTMRTGDGDDVVTATNLTTGNAAVTGDLFADFGAGADDVTLEQVATNGGGLVLLSDGGARDPGGDDTVILNDVDLGAGNLTLRTGAGIDTVALDAILSTRTLFIELGAGADILDIGQNNPLVLSMAKNLLIRGRGGADTITVGNVETTGRLGIRTHRGDDIVTIGGTNQGVTANSMVIDTGAGNDTLKLVSAINLPGAKKFRAQGGPGNHDRTEGEGVLPYAYRYRYFKFEDRNS